MSKKNKNKYASKSQPKPVLAEIVDVENEKECEISEDFPADGTIAQPKEDNPQTDALKAFKEYYDKNPNRQRMTDDDARMIHRWWQIVTGRTDYYIYCGVCTANQWKVLKRKAKDEGFDIQ